MGDGSELCDGSPREPDVDVVAEVRCTACKGKRGRALLAVVYSDGERRWLVMGLPPSEDAEPVTVRYLIKGDGTWPGLSSAAQLEALRLAHPAAVWLLESTNTITDSAPLASIPCPQCSRDGFVSSWFIDVRKLGEAIIEGTVVKLAAPQVSAGEERPVLDRDLGYRPHRSSGRPGWESGTPER